MYFGFLYPPSGTYNVLVVVCTSQCFKEMQKEKEIAVCWSCTALAKLMLGVNHTWVIC